YDTINRTLKSWLIMIELYQEWSWTSIMPPNLHDWRMFITPAELVAVMADHGLENRGQTGLAPAASPVASIGALRARKRGEISYLEATRRLKLRESRDKSVLYIGCAIKSGVS